MNFVHRDPGPILCPRGRHGDRSLSLASAQWCAAPLCPRGRHGDRSLSLASAQSRAAPVQTVEDQGSSG
jgi:hypothetical protein